MPPGMTRLRPIASRQMLTPYFWVAVVEAFSTENLSAFASPWEPRELNIIFLTLFLAVTEMSEPKLTRANSRSALEAGAEREESQDVFMKAIHPTCQSVPLALQEGALSAALELMHSVTQVLRLTASFLARKIPPENSLAAFVILLLTMKSPIAGAASIPRMAAKATVTINSISVNPLPLE